MEHDAWFFVGVFAFIFLIWVATGGPSRPLSFAGPTLSQPQELGGGTYLGLPRAPFAIGGSTTHLPGSSDGYTSPYSGSYRGPSASLRGVSFGDPSPHRENVTLSSRIANASSTNPRTEYAQLTLSSRAANGLSITGWKLVSEVTGRAASIPYGTPVPLSGSINPKESIVLAPGDRAYITTGGSPLGTSFRENKCSGYLAEFQSFVPSLSLQCPAALDDFKTSAGLYYMRDTSCVEFLQKQPRCKAVLFPSSDLSSSCRSFARQYLNYNGCVAAHRNDADFTGHTWRIYLGYSDPLWRAKNEIIKLFDLSSKTVGMLSY